MSGTSTRLRDQIIDSVSEVVKPGSRPTFEECLAEAYIEHVTAFYDELEQVQGHQ